MNKKDDLSIIDLGNGRHMRVGDALELLAACSGFKPGPQLQGSDQVCSCALCDCTRGPGQGKVENEIKNPYPDLWEKFRVRARRILR